MGAVSPMIAIELGRNRHAVRDLRRTVRQGFWAAATMVGPMWLFLWQAEFVLAAMGQDPGRLRNCRMAPVVREFRRTIAYDVDYVYRGSRFRTRMGRDPGNRLRIRISIMPAPLD